MGARLAFLSYRTKRAREVAPFVAALEAAGVQVWRDEARIDEGASITDAVLDGLSRSHLLLAWYSTDYPASRICQWEQALAWVAAETGGRAQDRVLLLLPPELDGDARHVLGVSKDHLAWTVPSGGDDALAAWAQRIADRIAALDGRTFGELAPLRGTPEWLLRPHIHPSARFMGRAKDLWALHAGLHADRVVAVTGSGGRSTAQVRGMGGIGKTLLAVEYAARFGHAFPGGVFWVDTAERTPEGVLGDVAIALGLPPNEPARAKAALAARGTYLWVVDNLPRGLEQPDVERWCAPTANGRTLITTRSRTWSALGRALDLDVLEPDEAFELLTKRCPPSESEAVAASALCEAVGRHPLALDVLGALIEGSATDAPYTRWLDRLRDPTKDALELAADLEEQLPTGCSKSVATVLRASLEGLPEEAKDLLRLAATLTDAPIPATLALQVFEALGDGSEAEDRWTRARNAAVARSLIEAKPPPGAAYTVHALVRRLFTFDAGEGERLVAMREAALRHIDAAFDEALDIRAHEPMLAVLPHAEHFAEPTTTAEQARLAVKLGIFHGVRGNYAVALAHETSALEARTRIFGPEHPDTLSTLQNLAVTLKARGDLAGARQSYERALEARTRILGPEHPDTLRTLQNLAVTLEAQGDLAGARRSYERALEAMTRNFGPEHPDTLRTLQNLAGTLDAQGDHAGARRSYERALEAMTRTLGPEHPDTQRTRYNLVLTLLGLEPEAARVHLHALDGLAARSLESLSAVERRIRDRLPTLRAKLSSPAQRGST